MNFIPTSEELEGIAFAAAKYNEDKKREHDEKQAFLLSQNPAYQVEEYEPVSDDDYACMRYRDILKDWARQAKQAKIEAALNDPDKLAILLEQ